MRPLALLLVLAACGRGPSDAELAARNRRLADAADPAVTAALADPIMTDRDLSVADNSRRVRLVAGPAQASYPDAGGEGADAFAPLRALGDAPRCEAGFVSAPRFAAELPLPFRPAPSAALIEAAGNDRPGCRARFALFRVTLPAAAVAEAAGRRARAAGYGAELRPRGADRIVAGRRADGLGYYLLASPRAGGSEVAVIASIPAR